MLKIKTLNFKNLIWLITITLIFAVVGWLTFFSISRLVYNSFRQDINETLNLSLAAVNPDRVKNLQGTEADIVSPDYLRLKEQLLRIGDTLKNKGIDSIYLTRQKDGQVFFLVDSMATTNPRHSPPGIIYRQPPQADVHCLPKPLFQHG